MEVENKNTCETKKELIKKINASKAVKDKALKDNKIIKK